MSFPEGYITLRIELDNGECVQLTKTPFSSYNLGTALDEAVAFTKKCLISTAVDNAAASARKTNAA